MVRDNPDRKSKAVRNLQNEMGLSDDETIVMISAQKSGKLRELRDSDNDNDLKPPEEEVKEKVPVDELDIVKQIFTNTQTDDFKSVDSPAGQAITLDAKAHPELDRQDIGYDTWLVIRGPLVTKTKNELVVGMGRAVVIAQPE